MVDDTQNLQQGPGWKPISILSIIAIIYLCVGAVVFQKIEGQPEIDRRKDLKAQINKFLGKNHFSLQCVKYIDHSDNNSLRALGFDTKQFSKLIADWSVQNMNTDISPYRMSLDMLVRCQRFVIEIQQTFDFKF